MKARLQGVPMTKPDQELFDLPIKAPVSSRRSTKRGTKKTSSDSAGTQVTARKSTRRSPGRRRSAQQIDPRVQNVIETYATEDRLENTPLKKYLGASTAKALASHLGLETVGQALEYYPRKYLPRGQLTPFSSLVEGSEATIVARVLKVTTRQMASRRGSITEITITDQLNDQPQELSADSHLSVPRSNPNSYRGAAIPAAYQPGYSNPRLVGSAGGVAGYPQNASETGRSFNSSTVFSAYAPEPYALVGNSGTMTLSFFNAWTAAREIHEGDQVMFSGKVGTYRGELTLTNPHYAVITDHASGVASGASPEAIERARLQANAPIPVYKATPKYPTDRVASALEALLERISLKELEDPVPFTVRKTRKIPSLEWTYRAVHTPDTEETWRAAHHSLRYREAFVLQAALARIRAARSSHQTLARPFIRGGLADALIELLPYKLTEGQETVGAEIRDDLASSSPMNRLLQGDVGSGKTVVALRAMLQVADNGAQAAMLAPTEVLAEQHYRSVCQILGDLLNTSPLDATATSSTPQMPEEKSTVRVVLLTASLKAKAKREVLLAIASGAADIIIGTHALLADAVQFADLGLVVVDEQHRFGVEQRDALRGPGGALPHRLVMTATPIPRTVAMTVFGDLDTSVLDQLPAGRQKITTHVVPLAEHPTWARRIWSRAREEIDAGHQVYVVVPKIGGFDSSEEAETGDTLFGSGVASTESARGGVLASVESVLEDLKSEPALVGVRIAGLHGRMDTAEKNNVMTEFSAGEVDLLVSTTVIEVGVNVPNATLMVIMDADRFGISGLHQLRGRIGRGQFPGTCLLVTKQPADGVSRERLKAVAATTDGFMLSRVDLEQRREGDILGAAQSGKKSTLKLLRALTDAKLIERARQDAFAVIEKDPTLALHPDLARTIDRALDADREAFLGRG